MSTPTCNHCGTKFPGRDRCRECGADPNSKRTLADVIRQTNKALTEFGRLMQAVPPKQRRAWEKAQRRSRINNATRRPRKHGRPR